MPLHIVTLHTLHYCFWLRRQLLRFPPLFAGGDISAVVRPRQMGVCNSCEADKQDKPDLTTIDSPPEVVDSSFCRSPGSPTVSSSMDIRSPTNKGWFRGTPGNHTEDTGAGGQTPRIGSSAWDYLHIRCTFDSSDQCSRDIQYLALWQGALIVCTHGNGLFAQQCTMRPIRVQPMDHITKEAPWLPITWAETANAEDRD